jgi:hypothetical protein
MTRSAPGTLPFEHAAERAPRHSVQRLVRQNGHFKYSITRVTNGQKIKRNPTTQKNAIRTCDVACSKKRSIQRGRKQAQKQIRKHAPMHENIRSRKINRATRSAWSDCSDKSGSKLTRSHKQPTPSRRQPRNTTPRSFALFSKSKRLPDSAIPCTRRRTPRMTYRRRQTPDASLADWRSQTRRLAAVRSIRFLRPRPCHREK